MSTQPNGIYRDVEEETPLLGCFGKPSGLTYARRVRKHFNTNVTKDWADLVLLFCYIITGLLDSSALHIWGAFVSMQTGNTVYLGLGIIAPHSDTRWIKSGLSILSFCTGSFIFARFHRHFSPAKRWVLMTSYGVQMLLIVLAASIVTWGKGKEGANDPKKLHWQVMVPLVAVAFQSSGQAVTSRALNYNGLTSVVLTSNYCDLFSDKHLWNKDNVERNRRIAAPLLLLGGACLGGLFSRSPVGLAGALWTAVALKFVTVVAWMFWKAETEDE